MSDIETFPCPRCGGTEGRMVSVRRDYDSGYERFVDLSLAKVRPATLSTFGSFVCPCGMLWEAGGAGYTIVESYPTDLRWPLGRLVRMKDSLP